MKKTFALLIGIACSLQGMAQNNEVTSAILHLKEFEDQRDTSELTAATASIDKAAVNEKTKDEPKMYLYRGEVYLVYFTIRLGRLVSKLAITNSLPVSKATAQAYTDIDTNAICIAANSFIRVLQLVPKDYYADEARQGQNLPTCFIYLENKALQEYNAQHYATALALYKRDILVCNLLNISDSTYTENIGMAASSAYGAGDNAQAIGYYKEMMDLKFGGAIPYHAMAALYLKQNDSADAWSYIEKGRAMYPDNLDLIITETNFYLSRHDYQKAQSNLLLSINKMEQMPDKDKNTNVLSSLYSNLGNIYDHMANPRDAQGKDLPKPADYDSLFAKAATNYTKALALAPDNFDVLYVTGALYFNRAVTINKETYDLPLNATAQYNKLTAQAKGYFLQAQPYFERAYKINPNDASNTNALMQVYASTGQDDKLEAMKNKK